MENAVKALEYAFAGLMFIIALTVTMRLLSEVRTTSDIMFSQIDTKRFYEKVVLPEDEENAETKGRIVNIETIVPTLYRYYKENFIVEFYNSNEERIIRFDPSYENQMRQIWTGNPEVDVKKRLDLFLQGSNGTVNNNSYIFKNDIAFVGSTKITKGLYEYCKGKKFEEIYAYVLDTSSENLETNQTRMVIRYKEVNLNNG